MAELTIVPGSIQLIKMTDAEYFSSKYKDYISNSRLNLIDPNEGGSPEKFKTKIKSEYSDSFELGSAIHAMILQPEFYLIADINKPTGKLGVWAESVYKYRQEGWPIEQSIAMASFDADYYAKSFSLTRQKTAIKNSLDFYLKRIHFVDELDKQTLFLSTPIKLKLEQCLLGIAENPKIMETLYPKGLFSTAEVFNEYAILCDIQHVDEVTGEITIIKFKAKLDNFTINHETCTITLNDLKSSGKPANFFMGNYVKITKESGEVTKEWYDGSFQKYHYYRQMAVYLWLLQMAIHEIYSYDYSLKANMVIIETIPNFKSKVYTVNNAHIKKGLNEFKNLLQLVVDAK